MVDLLSFQDSFSHEGFWWLPENPEDRVSGTLTFSQTEGPSLQLLGVFGGVLAFNREMSERTTIHGITKKGKRITLPDAFVISRQMNAPGIMNEQYRPHLVCLGHHFNTEDDAIFDKSFFRFERLEEWLDSAPFHETWEYDPPKLNLLIDKGRSEELTEFGNCKIGKSSSFNTGSSSRTEYSIKVLSFLYCEMSKPKSINEHFIVANRMQELASLCTDHFLPLTHLSLRLHGTGSADRPSQEVEIFAQMQHPEAGSRPKHEHPLFSARELLAANDRAVENWFDQYETLAPAINFFFAITGEKEMFLNIRFLLAIQALEVFHRRTTEGPLMTKTEFQELRKRLTDAIPSDVAPKMAEKLKSLYNFANEPSLIQRLETILTTVNADFGETVQGFSDRFARKVVDTRNYNTHFTAKLEAKSMNGGELWWASRRIVMLLTYLFLKNIGIKAPAFREALERHREFKALFARPQAPV
jgi:ApeA N-terminal domain 1